MLEQIALNRHVQGTPSCRDATRVFPLADHSKQPRAGWQWRERNSSDTAQVSAWRTEYPRANFGVVTGDGLVVIDVDTYHGGSLEALPELPETYSVMTAHGGRHLYFSTPVPIACSASRIAPGVDVRGEGGYVVGAGSTLADGSYVAENGLPIAPLPSAWLILLTKPRKAGERVVRARRGTPDDGWESNSEARMAWTIKRASWGVDRLVEMMPASLRLHHGIDQGDERIRLDVERILKRLGRVVYARPNARRSHAEHLDEQALTAARILRQRFGSAEIALSFSDAVDVLMNGYGVDQINVRSKVTAGKIMKRACELGYIKLTLGSNAVGAVSDSSVQVDVVPPRTLDVSVNDARRFERGEVIDQAPEAVEHMSSSSGTHNDARELLRIPSPPPRCRCAFCKMNGTSRSVAECTAWLRERSEDSVSGSMYRSELLRRELNPPQPRRQSWRAMVRSPGMNTGTATTMAEVFAIDDARKRQHAIDHAAIKNDIPDMIEANRLAMLAAYFSGTRQDDELAEANRRRADERFAELLA